MQFADNAGPDQPAHSQNLGIVVCVDAEKMSRSDGMGVHANLDIRCSHKA